MPYNWADPSTDNPFTPPQSVPPSGPQVSPVAAAAMSSPAPQAVPTAAPGASRYNWADPAKDNPLMAPSSTSQPVPSSNTNPPLPGGSSNYLMGITNAINYGTQRFANTIDRAAIAGYKKLGNMLEGAASDTGLRDPLTSNKAITDINNTSYDLTKGLADNYKGIEKTYDADYNNAGALGKAGLVAANYGSNSMAPAALFGGGSVAKSALGKIAQMTGIGGVQGALTYDPKIMSDQPTASNLFNIPGAAIGAGTGAVLGTAVPAVWGAAGKLDNFVSNKLGLNNIAGAAGQVFDKLGPLDKSLASNPNAQQQLMGVIKSNFVSNPALQDKIAQATNPQDMYQVIKDHTQDQLNGLLKTANQHEGELWQKGFLDNPAHPEITQNNMGPVKDFLEMNAGKLGSSPTTNKAVTDILNKVDSGNASLQDLHTLKQQIWKFTPSYDAAAPIVQDFQDAKKQAYGAITDSMERSLHGLDQTNGTNQLADLAAAKAYTQQKHQFEDQLPALAKGLDNNNALMTLAKKLTSGKANAGDTPYTGSQLNAAKTVLGNEGMDSMGLLKVASGLKQASQDNGDVDLTKFLNYAGQGSGAKDFLNSDHYQALQGIHNALQKVAADTSKSSSPGVVSNVANAVVSHLTLGHAAFINPAHMLNMPKDVQKTAMQAALAGTNPSILSYYTDQLMPMLTRSGYNWFTDPTNKNITLRLQGKDPDQ